MNSKEEKILSSLKKNYEKGLTRYVLLFGVLSWGFPMFLFMSFIQYKKDNEITPTALIINFITYIIFGALFGVFMWKSTGKSIKKIEKENKKS